MDDKRLVLEVKNHPKEDKGQKISALLGVDGDFMLPINIT